MIKKIRFFFLVSILNLLLGCSFDNKTGIWSGKENEKKRIAELERQQSKTISIEKIYIKANALDEEIISSKNISLSKPSKNLSWHMPGLNLQNFFGNIYLPSINNNFLKKRVGKNKYSHSDIKLSPLTFDDNIYIADDTGSIYKINQNGKIIWKSNIYKKIYKKIYKNISFTIYKNKIYVADNIGFIYSLSIETGKVFWIKNHSIPFKSKIKIFDEKIYLINQDNRLLCLDINKGTLIWDNRSITSFIKTQNFLSLAISNEGDLISLDSSGNLLKVNAKNGRFYWSLSIEKTGLLQGSNFFVSSNITIDGRDIFFSTPTSIFSYNLDNGYINWSKNIPSKNTPIVDDNHVFTVSDSGYFVNLDRKKGEIIWSTNILKILKKKKQNAKIVGFILGSGKIYALSSNGYLIVSSALSGKVEYSKKVAKSISAPPIVSNGSLYILTEDSRILGFN
jgi:outer membrane protein assembly factor BamB